MNQQNFTNFEQMFTSPRLLVSVRNASEAAIAHRAGAQIIDVKEPSRGSLGRVNDLALQGVMGELSSCSGQVVISAAMSELAHSGHTPLLMEFSCLSYLKLGLAGMRQHTGWVEEWVQIRNRLTSGFSGQLSCPQWVAVAYVDEQVAEAPPISDVIQAAIETGCAGVLFDTFDKSGPGLLDLISLQQLKEMFALLRTHGLLGVAAGKVKLSDIPRLLQTAPDIIAVRSAACHEEKRIAGIDATAIQKLLQAISTAG